MVVRPVRHSVEPWIVGLAAGYEAVALAAHSDRLPTITQLVGRLSPWLRRSIELAAGVWLVYHFETEHHRVKRQLEPYI